MSDERLRSQLVTELQQALNEVARLSEMITVLRASHALNAEKLAELSNEWTAANLRASALRQEIERAEDAGE